MRKLSILSLIALMVLASLVSAFPVAAQDEESEGMLPNCTEEEWAAFNEGIAAYNEGIASLGEISSDVTEAAYGAALVGYDQFSYQFWSEVFPALPACAEVQVVAFVLGNFYDDLAVAAAYANIAGWAVTAEQAEAAEYFGTVAATRAQDIADESAAFGEMDLSELLGEELVACSEEELTGVIDGIAGYFEGYEAVQAEAEASAEGDDAVVLVATTVTTDSFATVYWDEVFPEVPACSEAQYLGYLAGSALDETNLIVALYLNAALEAEGGNTDIADALAASAEARAADLEETLAEVQSYLGGEEE